MELKIKGHSGCDIDVVREARDLFVYKKTHDVKYIPRLIDGTLQSFLLRYCGKDKSRESTFSCSV